MVFGIHQQKLVIILRQIRLDGGVCEQLARNATPPKQQSKATTLVGSLEICHYHLPGSVPLDAVGA